MGTKQNTPPRTIGQRSLHSSFFRSTNPGKCPREDEPKREINKEASHISLSDFLDRKLHRSNVPPKTVKGKSRPFSSPLGARSDAGCTGCHSVEKKENKQDKKSLPSQGVFEQFKRSSAEEEDAVDCCKTETVSLSSGLRPLHGGVGTSDSGEGTRKWRNPFEGDDEPRNSRKRLLVLGDNPASKQNQREESFINSKKKPLLVLGDTLATWQKEGEGSFIKNKKKPRHFYNHYGNGGGLWDGEREGVDAEEVGFGEIWEGVCSTTFGGIEWH